MLKPPPFEPRPRDFAGRFARRRVATIGQRRRRRHRGRRAAILLVAIAVPAFAAPGGWHHIGSAFAIGDAGQAGMPGGTLTLEPMPFEKPGDSFPGSAFYYLAADDADPLPPLADGAAWDGASSRAIAAGQDGMGASPPVARALRIDNSGVDRTRALECLTAAIYYEAASEPDAGQRAVAQVVLNRVAHASYPDTVCGVVYQGSERSTGCQFSFTCDGSLGRRPMPFFWNRARQIAGEALGGYVYRPVGLATHYHTFAVHPSWNARMLNIANIGAHRFFVMPGAAGQPGAFRFAYAGGEPIAAPHPRSQTPALGEDTALDPLAIQRAYEAGLKEAALTGNHLGASATAAPHEPARPQPAPRYTAEQQQRGGEALYRAQNLPQADNVRPEYRQSGGWIAQPASTP